MNNAVVVFVDGLPFSKANAVLSGGGLDGAFLAHPVSPSLGYSVNIKTEMFSGLTADEVGMFNEWTLAEPPGATLPFPDLRQWPLLDAVSHKVINRLGLNVANIPFPLLGQFEYQEGHGQMRDLELFSTDDVQLFLAEKLRGSRRDRRIIERFHAEFRGGKAFVSLVDLDLVGHLHGLGSDRYSRQIAWLAETLGRLAATVDGKLVVCSDHGMVNIDRFVNPAWIEELFGPPGIDTYAYFVDSTIVRFWVADPALRSRMEQRLGELDYGVLLDARQRRDFGISLPEFGTLIFVTHERVVFRPNFHGSGLRVKAMHGYLPGSDDGLAVLIAPSQIELPTAPLTGLDLYHILATVYGREDKGRESN